MNKRKGGLRNLMMFAVCLSFAFPPPSARAEMISTEKMVSSSKSESDREKIRAFASRADAERSLKALGVKPELARERIDALTDEEVATIAGRIDALPAGGSLEKFDIIIILLVAVLLIVAI